MHKVGNVATLILNPVAWGALPGASNSNSVCRPGLPLPIGVTQQWPKCCDKEKGLLSVAWPECDLEECWKGNNLGFQPLVTQRTWASKSFYPSHMWLQAGIHVTMCHAVPTPTNTFLLPVFCSVRQGCRKKGLSQFTVLMTRRALL